MLKLEDLAARQDFEIGEMSVSPSRRRISGPGGEAQLEPLIMHVFLLLFDSAGQVVTRNELFDACWGGTIVGDDSLNRAVAKVRRVGEEVAPGAFEIETIPRTGYRMTGAIVDQARPAPVAGSGALIGRRAAIGGGIAAVAVAGVAGWRWAAGRSSNGEVDALLERGEQALRLGESDPGRFFVKATEIDPNNAPAWGLLAFTRARSADDDPLSAAGSGLREAEQAIRNALAIDPAQPDARLARTILQNEMLDWSSREQAFREILADSPDNIRVMRFLTLFLHSVGRCRESLALTERALAIQPLTPDLQVRRALRLWVVGRTADADQVIGRALDLWPNNAVARNAQLMIFAFTGRTRAALAMIDEERAKPTLLSDDAASVMRVALRALETSSPADVAAARNALVDASRTSPAIAAYGILILPAIGELDAAFDVAAGFLLGRGGIIVRKQSGVGGPLANRHGWRNTFGLFTPPAKAIRLDSRFSGLTEGLGLADYWRRSGTGPDDFLFKA